MAAIHSVMSLKRKIFALDDVSLQNLIKLVGEENKCTHVDEILHFLEKMIDSLLSEEADRREFLIADFERMLTECVIKQEKTDTVKQSTKSPEKVTPALWRKDFKISGTIMEVGGLSFVSLDRQIKAGLEKGHTSGEIIEGVIRCITPGAKLRNYLEGKESLTLTELRGILHSHFKEQTPTELYKRLCNATQGITETASDFIMRALDLRQRVLAASSSEEAVPYVKVLVEKMFFQAVATGLREDNIRHRLRPTLTPGVTDVEVLKALNEITLNELEHNTKTKTTVAAARAQENKLLKELQTQVEELKGHVLQLQGSQQASSSVENPEKSKSEKMNVPRSKRKCEKCLQDKVERCTHCFKCGSEGHIARGCRHLNGQRSLRKSDQ